MSKITCAIWLALIALAQAELDFPAKLKEVDAPADAKFVSVDFDFTNRSNKMVTVAKVDPTCSCISITIKDSKLTYSPGESGVIRTTFDMGNFSGTVDKVVPVWLDNDPTDHPSLSLTVRVHIPVLISLEPKTVKWEIGSKAEPQSIHIEMQHTKPIHVISVNSSSKAFTLDLKTIEDGKSYDLVVTPVDTVSSGLAVFRVETDCEISKHKIQQAFGIIRQSSPGDTATKP